MHGARKGSFLFTYPTKYSPLLPYECLLDNTVFVISASSILIGLFFFFCKPFLLIQSTPKI